MRSAGASPSFDVGGLRAHVATEANILSSQAKQSRDGRVWRPASPGSRGASASASENGPMSDAPPISRFPVPRLDTLPDDMRERIEAVAGKSGFIPNVYLALAHRPDEWRAFFAYHDALMEREGGLTAADKELVVVATSAANDCLYCVVAHGAIARIRARNPLIADQVAVDWRKADVSDRQRAMLEFAVKLAVEPAKVAEADLEALRRHGFGDDDIWDIGAITALFALSNRMAHLSAMRPNDEFYLMGRLSKDQMARLGA